VNQDKNYEADAINLEVDSKDDLLFSRRWLAGEKE